MTGLLTRAEFEDKYDVRTWLASSSNGRDEIQSAIVNIRAWHDRRRNIKVYMYFDHIINDYVTERA